MTNLLPTQHKPGPDGLRIRALGELTVEIDGLPVPLGPVKQRLTLAILVSRPNTTVSVDVMVQAVWDDDPPASARKNLQAYVSVLRKLLAAAGGPERLVHRHGGYALRVSADELDLLRFGELVGVGRRAVQLGAAEHGAQLLREALELCHRPMLADLWQSQSVRDEAQRHAVRRVTVCEDWAETELTLGRAAVVADALADDIAEHPLRERLRAAQMTALHQAGRRTEALACYDELRQGLARELGLGVSPALEAIHRGLLTGNNGPAALPGNTATTRETPHQRTVLPTDLPDFTGREEDIRDLRHCLAGAGRIVVLHGPLGVGKTSLAVHVAHALQTNHPDGVLAVRMRREDGTARPVSSILAELCRAADLLGSLPEDTEEAAAVWRSWLARRRVLVLFDDVPDETSVRHLLPGTGAGSALITSRCRLAGLGPVRRVELGPFSSAESVTLLSRITDDGRNPSDHRAAERIAAALGHLPLALRVSGTKLAMFRHVSASEYADRLEQSTSLLDEVSVGDLSMRGRLTAWWHGLEERERGALHRLSRLPRRLFALADASAALGIDEEPARRILEGLVETGALGFPMAEVSAHLGLYEFPMLSRLFAQQSPRH